MLPRQVSLNTGCTVQRNLKGKNLQNKFANEVVFMKKVHCRNDNNAMMLSSPGYIVMF